jgi:hypothetical protein
MGALETWGLWGSGEQLSGWSSALC